MLITVEHIERMKNVLGEVSSTRKAKPLVQSWLEIQVDKILPSGDPLASPDIIIERDTILMLNVKTGRGASSTTIY